VFGEYVDDGVKRTTPLAQRPGGRRFLVDARGGKFDTVLAMRLDRLARSLRVLLDANTALAVFCVSIKSAQEPLDTRDAFGNCLFQLLGSMPELELSTILERTALGRAKVAKDGKWTGGRIPFGYTVEGGHLVEHPAQAGIVRSIFANIAAVSSLVTQCKRLTEAAGKRWREWNLSAMLHNRLYLGEGQGNPQGEPFSPDIEAPEQRPSWALEMCVLWWYVRLYADAAGCRNLLLFIRNISERTGTGEAVQGPKNVSRLSPILRWKSSHQR
jgi:DNA invertase Pin-like site-specific DNA recombinase